jgi:7-cyano-7-deazaguanine synthase in queuosine biosynthesis
MRLQSVASTLGVKVPVLAMDLAQIAQAVYTVDRTKRRRKTWTRRLDVTARVVDVARWRSVRAEIEHTLHIATDDDWHVNFVSRATSAPEELQAALVSREISAIALFSGGLDSFAGAAHWLASNPGATLGLLSVQTSTVVKGIQSTQYGLLYREFGDRVIRLSVPLRMVDGKDAESTQRTRGFVFVSIAAAVASCAGSNQVLVFENGYGAINPRSMIHMDGAQFTKSTHPYFLKVLGETLALANVAVNIALPYGDYTKAELVACIPQALLPGIKLTASCDSFPLRRKGVKQCGYCTSCILRQQSLRSAGLAEYDRKDYAERPFDTKVRHPEFIRLMASEAKAFSELTSGAAPSEAAHRWPQIVLGESDISSLTCRLRLRLLGRYGREWQALVANDPALEARLGWRVAA